MNRGEPNPSPPWFEPETRDRARPSTRPLLPAGGAGAAGPASR